MIVSCVVLRSLVCVLCGLVCVCCVVRKEVETKPSLSTRMNQDESEKGKEQGLAEEAEVEEKTVEVTCGGRKGQAKEDELVEETDKGS